MKKNLLIVSLSLAGFCAFSQPVTSISIVHAFNSNLIEELCLGNAIPVWATILPANAANKTVKFSVDSGDAVVVVDSFYTPAGAYAIINATSEGTVVLKATAQDGSNVTATRRLKITSCQKVTGYRLTFDENNLYTAYGYKADTLQVFKESIEDGCLKLVVDKIGPISSPGIPTLPWKTFSYGFSAIKLSIGPGNGKIIDMSTYKNIRISMKVQTDAASMADGAKSGCRFSIGTRSPYDLSGIPMGGSNITLKTETLISEGGDFKSYVINYAGTSYNGATFTCDSSNVSFCYMVPNHGATWDLVNAWTHAEKYKLDDYKGTIWIKYIAFGSAADTVMVEKIDISGDDSLMFVPNFKLSYTASVFPSDATDKTFFWSTSDPGIAVIDGSGKITMKGPGTVKLIATAQDGSGVAGEKTIKLYCNGTCPVSIEGLSTDYTVYPNPVAEEIKIAGTSDLIKAELVDMSGRIIKSVINSKTGEVSIDVSGLAKGIYILKCYAENGEVIIKKIVKE